MTSKRNDQVAAIVPALEAKTVLPVIHDKSPVRITAEQADAEQRERVARATNTAPVERTPVLETPAGVSILALAVGEQSGMRLRRSAPGLLTRLRRALRG